MLSTDSQVVRALWRLCPFYVTLGVPTASAPQYFVLLLTLHSLDDHRKTSPIRSTNSEVPNFTATQPDLPHA